MFPTVEERVDRLEALFEQLVGQMGRENSRVKVALLRLEGVIGESILRADLDREEAKRERRELAQQLGDISNKMGTIVEDIIAPSLRRMAGEEFDCGELESFGIRIEKYHPQTRQRREFDVIVAGSKAVLLNQTKATARPEYAAEFVKFLQSGEFFGYFPEYVGRPLIPVFSSIHVPEDLVAYLTKQEIYAVGIGEETMEVLNLAQVRANR